MTTGLCCRASNASNSHGAPCARLRRRTSALMAICTRLPRSYPISLPCQSMRRACLCHCIRPHRGCSLSRFAAQPSASTGSSSQPNPFRNLEHLPQGAAASLSAAIASASVSATFLSFLDACLGRSLGSALAVSALSLAAYLRSSLTASGAAAALVIGIVSWRSYLSFAACILSFHVAGSSVTNAGKELKESKHDERAGKPAAASDSGRDYRQVVAAAALPTLIAVLHATVTSNAPPLVLNTAHSLTARLLAVAFLGAIACSSGDTFASEVGMLAREDPILVINPKKKVAPGTNGAITLLGTLGSACGGAFAGCVYASCTSAVPLRAAYASNLSNCGFALSTWELLACILFGTAASVIGSLIDSVLGATVQYSGWSERLQKVVHEPSVSDFRIAGSRLLSNTGVNVVSSLLTALITSLLAFAYFKHVS